MTSDRQFLTLIEGALDAKAGSIQMNMRLENIPEWDSLGALSVLAAMDSHFGVSLEAGVIADCQTVEELAALVNAKS